MPFEENINLLHVRKQQLDQYLEYSKKYDLMLYRFGKPPSFKNQLFKEVFDIEENDLITTVDIDQNDLNDINLLEVSNKMQFWGLSLIYKIPNLHNLY